MIYRLTSSLATFKSIEFKAGLNVLIAQKEPGSNNKQTRNRAGKTSLIEMIHFLLGSEAGPESLFRVPALVTESFGVDLDIGGVRTTVQRSASEKSKIRLSVEDSQENKVTISNSEWIQRLGEKMFHIEGQEDVSGRKPKFRSLLSYCVRRQLSGAFTTPEKQATMQQAGDYQVALMFLLGLDWQIAGDWQQVRDRERTLKELKKAAGAGAFGSVIGKASELRTQLLLAEARLKETGEQLRTFRILPEYRSLEAEADQITHTLNAITNQDTIDSSLVRDLEIALHDEAPPSSEILEKLYAEAGVALPGTAFKRYEEVKSFHESVIRNRKDYLSEELTAANFRIENRMAERARLDQRRAEILGILHSHGALEQFAKLQSETSRMGAEVESLRQRFAAAEQLDGTKTELEIERKRLTLRLRRDFSEQKDRLAEAILAFEATSKQLYESAGSMTLEETSNGPAFQFPMQGSRSKGIKNMQIFCFDIMLMRLCAKRGIGPGFLIHDSHLFDGVDGRQVISALKVGAETADELGFQYIVTMNEDDAFKETIKGFDLRNHVLPVVLTDATETGGLFGLRF